MKTELHPHPERIAQALERIAAAQERTAAATERAMAQFDLIPFEELAAQMRAELAHRVPLVDDAPGADLEPDDGQED